MGFAVGYVKCLLLMFLASFLLSGVTLLALGSMVLRGVQTYGEVGDFVQHQYFAPLITLLVVGSLIVLVSFFGCLALVKENHRMIYTFIGIVFFLFVCEVAISAVGFLRSNDINSNVKDSMRNSFTQYVTNPTKRSAFDAMQSDLSCCGVERPLDYVVIFYNASLPASCCVMQDGHMCRQAMSSNAIWHTGCYEAVVRYINWAGMTLGTVSMVVAFVGIVGIVVAILLVISLINEEKMMQKSMVMLAESQETLPLTAGSSMTSQKKLASSRADDLPLVGTDHDKELVATLPAGDPPPTAAPEHKTPEPEEELVFSIASPSDDALLPGASQDKAVSTLSSSKDHPPPAEPADKMATSSSRSEGPTVTATPHDQVPEDPQARVQPEVQPITDHTNTEAKDRGTRVRGFFTGLSQVASNPLYPG